MAQNCCAAQSNKCHFKRKQSFLVKSEILIIILAASPLNVTFNFGIYNLEIICFCNLLLSSEASDILR